MCEWIRGCIRTKSGCGLTGGRTDRWADGRKTGEGALYERMLRAAVPDSCERTAVETDEWAAWGGHWTAGCCP